MTGSINLKGVDHAWGKIGMHMHIDTRYAHRADAPEAIERHAGQEQGHGAETPRLEQRAEEGTLREREWGQGRVTMI